MQVRYSAHAFHSGAEREGHYETFGIKWGIGPERAENPCSTGFLSIEGIEKSRDVVPVPVNWSENPFILFSVSAFSA